MMMKHYDQSVEINHNLNWPYILNHHCRILIIGGFCVTELNKASATRY